MYKIVVLQIFQNSVSNRQRFHKVFLISFKQDNEGKVNNIGGNDDYEKKIEELTEQIKVHKTELADKQKEFAQEKEELQKVVEEQKQQLEKGVSAVDGAAPEHLEKLNKELQKAHKDLQEAAVERERFQAQLEMLVQELEQKQVKHQLN